MAEPSPAPVNYNWTVSVEKPDGAGGWTLVATVGTPTATGNGARHLIADSPTEAAWKVLEYYWPVNLHEFVQRTDGERWVEADRERAGIADHRIVVEPVPGYKWRDQELPAPFTILAGEVRQMAIRTHVAALVAARARLKDLRLQVRRAQGDVALAEHRISEAAAEALNAGVSEDDVTKARQAPRAPRVPAKRSTGGRDR